MTVKEFIEDLKAFHPEAQIRLASGPGKNWNVLSIYGNTNTPKCTETIVWIDIEQEGKPESRASAKKRLGL